MRSFYLKFVKAFLNAKLLLALLPLFVISSTARADSSDFLNVLNASFRSNTYFSSFDDETQARTFALISSYIENIHYHDNATNYGYNTWISTMMRARSLTWQQIGQTITDSPRRLSEHPEILPDMKLSENTPFYLNFGVTKDGNNFPTNSAWEIYVVEDSRRIKNPNPDFADTLTGDLRENSPHYQCTYDNGGHQYRVYGLDARSVLSACDWQASREGVSSRCATVFHGSNGASCSVIDWSTNERFELIAELKEGNNPGFCHFGNNFLISSLDPFQTDGECVGPANPDEPGKLLNHAQFVSYLEQSDYDLSDPLNPEIVSLIGNSLWEFASIQPGYDGVPFQGSFDFMMSGISTFTAQAFTNNFFRALDVDDVISGIQSVGYYPVLNDVGGYIPDYRNPSYNYDNWSIPAIGGALPDAGGGSSGSDYFDGLEHTSVVAASASGLIAVVLAVSGVIIAVFFVIAGVRRVKRFVQGG